MGVLHHVAFALAVAALGAAGLRTATLAGARGLELVVAAAPLAAAASVMWALALGLAGVGGSTPALAATAALTWTAVRVLVPAPDPPLRLQLADRWAQAPPPARAVVGACAAAALALCAWQLKHPYVTLDGLTYHLSLPATWLRDGSPGAVVDLLEGVPVGNYPLTNEVLVGWALGLTQSWVIASLITPALAALLAVAIWTGLRGLDVPPLVALLAAAAFITLPLNASQLGGPQTDLAATAWLGVAAALVALSLRGPRPLLLVPALVAAGLAVGTKTTPVLPLVAVLVFGLWYHRRALAPLKAPLGAATLAALIVAAVWPLRNLLDHGSPLWPFVSTSFGDPVPPALAPFKSSFIDHPGDMLRGREPEFAKMLGGALVLLPAALLTPLVSRSRAALVTGAVVAVAFVLWLNAPYTGIDTSTELAVGTTRYLLPTLLAATVAIAFSARGARPPIRAVVVALLTLATLVSAARNTMIGFPLVPGTATMLAAAAVGTAIGWFGGRRPPAPAWVAPAVAVAAGTVLAIAAPGYVARHGETFGVEVSGYSKLLSALAARPGYEGGAQPVAMGAAAFALLGGDELRHPVVYVPSTQPCGRIRAHADRGWLVVADARVAATSRLVACMKGVPPLAHFGRYYLYGPS